jgi:formate C-acetyltransferase
MSVAKLPYEDCQDGVSWAVTLVPAALGADVPERIEKLQDLLDDLFQGGLSHVSVNV